MSPFLIESLAGAIPPATAKQGRTVDPPVHRPYLANRAGAVNHRQFVGQGRPTAGPQLGRAGGRTRLTHRPANDGTKPGQTAQPSGALAVARPLNTKSARQSRPLHSIPESVNHCGATGGPIMGSGRPRAEKIYFTGLTTNGSGGGRPRRTHQSRTKLYNWSTLQGYAYGPSEPVGQEVVGLLGLAERKQIQAHAIGAAWGPTSQVGSSVGQSAGLISQRSPVQLRPNLPGPHGPICFAEGLSESRPDGAVTGTRARGQAPLFLTLKLNFLSHRLESCARYHPPVQPPASQSGGPDPSPPGKPTRGGSMSRIPYVACRVGWSTALAVAGGALALLTVLSLLDRSPRQPPQRCARRNCRKRFQPRRDRQAFCSTNCARRCGIGSTR